ncbi:type I glyceraldehyde-3-phosphate dehydrogenase [candidate division WOR-3 bacterium]|uniref:Glyceraldehyde-3-phosphate dehydrogenase n=1 Tax=candidate division WOR-3 bacterium TaxID=2052148 RepID=A0A9D5KA74_UNCW3|nr:type I glyceraldehyde-3-phosphate dehydrogenase [candidate division WOR-3 bacterium]MBD3364420.1 type I glyceraldehyde-3-phosphate dehydrogenase [candidate division WOR-3 bacterium]
MATRVAINGFGRIGRIFLRTAIDNPNLEFVGVNDITDAESLAHLLRHDSVHRNGSIDVKAESDNILVNNKPLKVLSEKDPVKLPWRELGAEVVVESTGIFRKYEDASKHLDAGAKKVVISAPAKGEKPVPTFVMGINHKDYKPDEHHVVSNASCTTNALAPLVKVADEAFGIEKAFMSTIHAYTGDQNIVDGPHKDLRRARAAAVSLVPTTTGATRAITKVMPHLEGKLSGMAFRIPTPDVSIVDLAILTKTITSADDVNVAFHRYSEGDLKGILAYSDTPLVSVDYTSNPASAVFDSLLTQVVDGNLIKIFGWYDNEWGYAARTRDLILHIGEQL